MPGLSRPSAAEAGAGTPVGSRVCRGPGRDRGADQNDESFVADGVTAAAGEQSPHPAGARDCRDCPVQTTSPLQIDNQPGHV
jgi:hypothetical protein